MENSDKTYTISELTDSIKITLQNRYSPYLWVQGEIIGYNRAKHRPHIYFEMVEKDEGSDNVMARLNCVMFQGSVINILEKLSQCENYFILEDGLEVRFKCKVDFYPPQGKLQLTILDIDPIWTLGKIAQNRQKIIEELKKNGLLDKNKQLQIPEVPIIIGLLTSYNSAAYNDFISELKRSGYGFKVIFYNVIVQGKETEATINCGIGYFNQYEDVDVLVITRGGGSRGDLSWFDNKNIAMKIANSRFPVITGIGHEIDVSVADMVANCYFKTPTAVAQFLISQVENYLRNISTIFQELQEESRELIFNKKIELKTISGRFNDLIKYIFKDLRGQLSIFIDKLSPKRILKNLKNEKDDIVKNIKILGEKVEKFLKDRNRDLEFLEEKKNYLDPKNILKKGFCLAINKENKIIKNVNDVKIGENIDITLRDGILNSKILSRRRNVGEY